MDEELRAKIKKWFVVGSFFALAVLFYAMGWRTALVAYVIVLGVLATLAILIQSGKGGGLAASLGGLGGESVLGVRSATPIAKATYVMLALFIVNCMLVARMPVRAAAGQGVLDVEQSRPALEQPPSPLPEQVPEETKTEATIDAPVSGEEATVE